MKTLPILLVILTHGATILYGQSTKEIEQITKMAIDLKELQPYYHEKEIESRVPLIIMNDSILPFEIELSKFGVPVKIVTKEMAFMLGLNSKDHSLLEIISFNATSNQAQIEFDYLPEEIRITIEFEKSDKDLGNYQ